MESVSAGSSVTLSVPEWPGAVLMLTVDADGAVTATETPYRRTLLGKRYGVSRTYEVDPVDVEFWIIEVLDKRANV